jgi:predicted RNase H-like HicB family nuclease
MNALKIIVSGGKDHYGAWAKDAEGIYGVGCTLDEVRDSIREAVSLYLECNENAPSALRECSEIELIFDITGLLKYYSEFITFSAMEGLTGVDGERLRQYANGCEVPCKETAERIETGLKRFAQRLVCEEIDV